MRLQHARSSFFDLSIDLLCIASLEGRFLDLNEAWIDTLGWELADLLARPFMEFVHPDDRELTAGAMGELSDGRPIMRFRNRYAHQDGTWRWLEWTARSEPGRGLVYAVAHDITHQHQLETELRAANEELRAANQLKDHFIATASHELRTPITSIAGFSTTVLDRWETLDDGDRRRFIEIIDAQSQRLIRLVDELLDMARLDSGSIDPRHEPVAVLPLLEDAIMLLVETDASLECAPGLVVTADPDYLAQALTNVVANAARHGLPPFALEASSVDGRARISVVDHGAGVSDAFRPHLFDKFTQARRDPSQPVEGTGLGLSIARGLVRAMDGDLTYEAVRPRGASFVIDLPIAT